MKILPWQEKTLTQTPPAPAFLVIGEAGIGADKFTLALAAKFAGTDNIEEHPDILLIRPEKNMIRIKADQTYKGPAIHELINFCAFKPIILNHRVAVIMEAEKMNQHAANALLKTLEEPNGKKIIILWARTAQQLPPTIVSRCRRLNAPLPDTTIATQWMKESGVKKEIIAFYSGQPLLADDDYDSRRLSAVKHLRCGDSLDVHAAGKIFADDEIWLECLQKWAADGVRVAAMLPARFFPDCEEDLKLLCCGRLRPWLDFHALLIKKRRWHEHPLARELLIKDTLNEYRQIFR